MADDSVTIVDAMAMFRPWHGDQSPLGATGNYALDLALADAFRALLFRSTAKERLDWIERELKRPLLRPWDLQYEAELRRWWLAIWDTNKAPVIELRKYRREMQCASF